MSLRRKAAITGLIIACLIATTGLAGSFSLSQYGQKSQLLTEAIAKVNDIQNERAEFHALDKTLQSYYESPTPGSANAILVRLLRLKRSARRVANSNTCAECAPALRHVTADLEVLRSQIYRINFDIAAGRRNDVARDRAIIDNIIERISARLMSSSNMTAEASMKLQSESRAAYKLWTIFIILASAITIVIVAFLNRSLAHSLAASTHELRQATREFAEGNRSRRVRTSLPQEFSGLASAFNKMADTIQASENDMRKLNQLLTMKVGEQEGRLQLATSESEHKVEEIGAQIQISQALSSALAVDEILNRAAKTLASVFCADYATVSLISEDSLSHCWELERCNDSACPAYKSTNLECWTLSKTSCDSSHNSSFEEKISNCVDCEVFKNIKMKVKASIGIDERVFLGKELATHQSLFGKALLTLKPVIALDLSATPQFMSFRNVVPDCKAQFSFPLITKNRVLGTVNLGYRSGVLFDDDEIRLIESLCNQIAIGIENARLFERTNQSLSNMSLLYKSSEKLSSLLQKREISKSALQTAMQIAGAEAGIVLTLNERTGRLQTDALRKINKELKRVIGNGTGNTISAHVMRTQESLLLDDRYERHGLELGSIKSGVFAPLQYNGQFFGLLGLVSLKGKIFSYSDLELLSMIGNQVSTAMHNTYLFSRLEELYIDTVKAFVQTIEAKDSYTRGHSENVAMYATAIARKMNLASARTKTLETAALLHDIGKIGIKEEVLNKAGRLTGEEYEHIKQHPYIAYQILEHLPSLSDVAKIVLHHHEKYDGSGYISGLKGEQIPLESRILAIADTFDAMTSYRPYRDASSAQAACSEITKNAGTQFDPRLVDVFVDLLNSGELGAIINRRGASAIETRAGDEKAGEAASC